jgi:phenylalanyl-tRNA synthetase beta chain
MRQSLLASVLEIVERNARQQERLAFFEVGEVFMGSEGGVLPDEHSRLVIVLAGLRTPPAWQGGDTVEMDFFDLKGVIAALFDGLHIDPVYEPGTHPSFHPGKCAYIELDGRRLGTMGEIHPEVAIRYDLEAKTVLAASLNMEALLDVRPDRYETRPVVTFPPVIEDLALIVPESVPAAVLESLIRQTGGDLVAKVDLFDLYRGAQVGSGNKSLAYRITYQSADRTLNDKDVAKLRSKIVGRLEREVGAQLRG